MSPLNPDRTIADDVRIQRNLPTIKYLLKTKTGLFALAKLDRPKNVIQNYHLCPLLKDCVNIYLNIKLL